MCGSTCEYFRSDWPWNVVYAVVWKRYLTARALCEFWREINPAPGFAASTIKDWWCLGVFAICQCVNVFAFLQVLYAARDAQVSVALFLHLLGFACLPATSKGENSVSGWEKVLSKCQGLVDIPFKGRKSGSMGEDRSGEARSPHKGKNRRSVVNVHSSGSQQVRDPRRQKRKPLGVGYSAR